MAMKKKVKEAAKSSSVILREEIVAVQGLWRPKLNNLSLDTKIKLGPSVIFSKDKSKM